MDNNKKQGFAMAPKNYWFVFAGFILIILGFLLMTGGASDSPDKFSEAIFSFRRIVLAPIVILIGFGLEIFAIMWSPKKKQKNQ